MFSLFAINIFLSSFLIFLIQPIFTKLLLPHLGNTPLVWNCSMIFYQILLLLGYLYAFLLSRISSFSIKIALHLLILLASLFFIPIDLKYYDLIDRFISPHLWLFSALLASICLIFFVLSSNAPLNQEWFARTSSNKQKIYSLYSISNLGNLIALISYPIFEYYCDTELQQNIFSLIYLIFFSSIIACACVAVKKRHKLKTLTEINKKITRNEIVQWLILSIIPSSLMIGVTNQLTENLVNSAIFWLLPLALYLLSYILAFLPKPPALKLLSSITPYFALATMGIAVSNIPANSIVYALDLTCFFLISYVLTARLASITPEKINLTFFYLVISFGSILGSLFNSIIAPEIFASFIEYPLVILLSIPLMLMIPLNSHANFQKKLLPLIGLIIFAFFTIKRISSEENIVMQKRNFFGINRITKDNISGLSSLRVANKQLSQNYDLSDFIMLGSLLETADKIAQVGSINPQFCQLFKGKFDYFEPNEFVKDAIEDGHLFADQGTCISEYKIFLGDPRLLLKDSPPHKYQAIIFDFNSLNNSADLINPDAINIYKEKLSHHNSFMLFLYSAQDLEINEKLKALSTATGMETYMAHPNGNIIYLVMTDSQFDNLLDRNKWKKLKASSQ